MSPKKEDGKKDPVASLEELEKTVAMRPKKTKAAEPAAPAPARREAAPAAAPAPKAKTKPQPEAKNVTVRLVKSGICTPKDQKATLLGIGLRRINQEVVRLDTPSMRGMLHKVRHLVEVTAAK